MRQKDYFAMSAIAIVMATLLCGCGNVDGNVISADSEEDSEQTSELIYNLPIISSESSIRDSVIESEINFSTQYPTTAKIYQQKRKTFTEEQFFNLFDEEPRQNDRSTSDYIVYDNDHQHAFLYEGKNLTFYTDTGDLFDSVYFDYSENPDEISGEYIDENGELAFASRNEVLEKIAGQMQSKFGISSEEWEADSLVAIKKEAVDCYKSKIIQNARESEDSTSSIENNDEEKAKVLAEKYNALPSDEFYYIKLKFKIDEIPIYSGFIFTYGADRRYSIYAPECYLIYTKNGIEYIVLYYLYANDTSEGTPIDTELIGTDEALNILMQKYNSIIFNGEIEVYDMNLIYLPIPQNDLDEYFENFETRPFYAFSCRQTEIFEGERVSSEFVAYIDAITGRDLGTESI